MAGKNGDDRSGQADRPEEEDRFACAKAVHKIAADQYHDHIREAVDALKQSDIGVGETKLLAEQVGDRLNAIVDVVVAEHGHADEHEYKPAVGRRW